MKRHPGWLGAALAVTLALGPAHTATAMTLRGVIGTGATPASGASGSGRLMRATAGQPVVGSSAGSSKQLAHGYWGGAGAVLVAVDGPDAGGETLPLRFDLGPARPNPARGAVAFAVALPRAADVRLEIYDLAGRRVDEASLAGVAAGYRAMRWSGARGIGVYFARLMVDGRPLVTRRFVMLR